MHIKEMGATEGLSRPYSGWPPRYRKDHGRREENLLVDRKAGRRSPVREVVCSVCTSQSFLCQAWGVTTASVYTSASLVNSQYRPDLGSTRRETGEDAIASSPAVK